ncbi:MULTISPECIES: DUF3168 domain-containing protein [unclassified Novosphingobium]|uniref:DUF3168 domain-containing protein n=1 Tax=unclassified Novosphingobium TaxID=2644732 RepID=UPI000EE415B9|nr:MULTISPECIES: DUF3168 domain-containing protein [unclassified Novosphingobium]HCF24629.1 DUF3168 domain-containing protein [Novosphingobium sp.]HQV04239.1 DUF3168 domain-containing protein [Novosphingobium sp.]
MEIALRSAVIAWLRADPGLSAQLNAVVEEVPQRTALPWLAIAASASADWSVKDRPGREVRLALELHCRGDKPDSAASLVAAIEARISSLPAAQPGFQVVTAQFLRARAEQRASNTRAVLLEYRFRLLAD